MTSIKEAIVGLDFNSESNSPWKLLSSPGRKPSVFTCHYVNGLFGRDPAEECEALVFSEWFDHVIDTQPQHTEYKILRDACLAELTSPQVFRLPGIVGNYNLIYVVIGFTASGVYGCYTYAVET